MGKMRQDMVALVAAASLLPFTLAAQERDILPIPEQPFSGVIGKRVSDSQPAFSAPVRAPNGAPNVVVIMTDDVGFGATRLFGGPVPTPAMDALAAAGIRYNRFHNAGICSPTRAALLTGRNHHAVGAGLFPNLITGFPGYNARLPRSAASIAEVLRLNGYSTAMFGKNHSTPEADLGPTGPFDLWPTGLGFEYFYGFNGYDANQWSPQLYENTVAVTTIDTPGYHLDRDLADRAIHWMKVQRAAAPEKPFFFIMLRAAPMRHTMPRPNG